MRNVIKTLLLAVTFAGMTFGLSSAASAESNRIAVVDVGAIFQQLPQREQISQSLQREFSDRINRMQQMEQEIGGLRERIQRDEAIMSEAERNEAIQEFEQRVGEAQQRGEELNQEMRRRQDEERDRLLRRMQQVITTIAEDQGYDLVLEANSVAFARDRFDISSLVIEAMTND